MTQLYDEIGVGYRNYRRPDARIAAAIVQSLGDAEAVVNVGAGVGSLSQTELDLGYRLIIGHLGRAGAA